MVLRLPEQATYDARIHRSGHDPVAVIEPEIRGAGLELRAPGLWADHVCEEDEQRWTVGLEAFGIVFDPEAEVGPDTRGERVPVGLDLEWERSGPLERESTASTFLCTVQGEVLLGPDTIAVDGAGRVSHAWEDPDPQH